jgi:hypothetical protein
VAYGASLESWLGASPHGFESHILRSISKNPVKSMIWRGFPLPQRASWRRKMA